MDRVSPSYAKLWSLASTASNVKCLEGLGRRKRCRGRARVFAEKQLATHGRGRGAIFKSTKAKITHRLYTLWARNNEKSKRPLNEHFSNKTMFFSPIYFIRQLPAAYHPSSSFRNQLAYNRGGFVVIWVLKLCGILRNLAEILRSVAICGQVFAGT